MQDMTSTAVPGSATEFNQQVQTGVTEVIQQVQQPGVTEVIEQVQPGITEIEVNGQTMQIVQAGQ